MTGKSSIVERIEVSAMDGHASGLNIVPSRQDHELPTIDSPVDQASFSKAKSRSLIGDLLVKAVEKAGDIVAGVADDVLRGYPRLAKARTDYYPVAFDGFKIDLDKTRLYRAAITGDYHVEDADQSFLQKITGKFGQYVYGANHFGRLFVDKVLKGKSPEQYWATVFHEAGHTAGPEDPEAIVESKAKAYAHYLSEVDSDPYVSAKAGQAYSGFLATEKENAKRGFDDLRLVA